MPVARTCPHCKKTFLASTYYMLRHVEKYHKDKSISSNLKKSKNITSSKINKPTPKNISNC